MTNTIFYQDELKDDFAGIKRKEKYIKPNYRYINDNFFWKTMAFVAHRIIMTPIAYLYCKIKFHLKIENKECLKKYKNKGYFLFGNHTNVPSDAYIPNLITFPKKPYFIVNPDSVAMKGTEQFMLMIGAMPLPSTFEGTKNFVNSVEKRVVTHNAMVIFPEAHVWPYYTKIRPYSSASFKYPVKFNDPSFAFTVCYKKRRYSKRPRIVCYVDGPFFPDNNLSVKAAQEKLRHQIITYMEYRSKESDYEYIKYVKKDQASD